MSGYNHVEGKYGGRRGMQEIDLVINSLAQRIADLEVRIAITNAKLVMALNELENTETEIDTTELKEFVNNAD